MASMAPSRMLVITGLPKGDKEKTEGMLTVLFSQFTGFSDVRLAGDNSIGVAGYESVSQAVAALQDLQGVEWAPGRKLSLVYAPQEEPSSARSRSRSRSRSRDGREQLAHGHERHQSGGQVQPSAAVAAFPPSDGRMLSRGDVVAVVEGPHQSAHGTVVGSDADGDIFVKLNDGSRRVFERRHLRLAERGHSAALPPAPPLALGLTPPPSLPPQGLAPAWDFAAAPAPAWSAFGSAPPTLVLPTASAPPPPPPDCRDYTPPPPPPMFAGAPPPEPPPERAPAPPAQAHALAVASREADSAVQTTKAAELRSRMLVVKGLPKAATQDMLNLLFGQFEGFREVRLAGDASLAVAGYEDERQAGVAIKELQGFQMGPGITITLTYAPPDD